MIETSVTNLKLEAQIKDELEKNFKKIDEEVLSYLIGKLWPTSTNFFDL